VLLLALLACHPTDDSPAKGDDTAATTDSGDSDPADTADSGDSDSGGSDSGDSDSGGGETGETADTAPPIVITGSITTRDNPDNPFSAFVTVTVDHDANVAVRYGEGALDHVTPYVAARAGVPVDVLVLGLRASRTFQMAGDAVEGDATWTGDPVEYTTAALPRGWPTVTPHFYVAESEYDRDEALCTNGDLTNGTNMYFCFDRWGEPVFSMRTADNDQMLSMNAMPDGTWAGTSISASKIAFFNAAGAETVEYNQLFFDGKTRYEHQYVDSHEAYPITEGIWAGDIAFVTDAYEYFDDGSYKLGNGIIVFNPVTRAVDYDFSFHGELGDQVAFSDMMPYSRTGIGDYTEDWNHTNAILHGTDPDGREYLLLSLKAQDWIFKLYPDTDELLWRLGFEGEFTLVDDIDAAEPVEQPGIDWAYHQHGMTMLSSSGGRTRLLMLDNGYPRHDDTGVRWDLYYSRVVEMEYDEGTMLASIRYEAGSTNGRSEDYFFSTTCGNTEMLPGDTSILVLDGENHQLREVGYPDGALRWTADVESREWCLYRAHWYPSLYETTWRYE